MADFPGRSRPAGGKGGRPHSNVSSAGFNEQARAGTHELALQQLAFFRKELRRGVAFLTDTPGLGRTLGIRGTLERVLDTATDLHDALHAKFALPSLSVSQAVDQPFEEAGIGGLLEDDDTGPVTSPVMLASNLQALEEQVVLVRESLIDNETLADLFAQGEDFLRAMAGGELLELASTLKELLDKTLELISMLPPDAGPAPQMKAPATQAPAQAPGLRSPTSVLVPTEEAPSGEDRPSSGEATVRSLQEFFNDNSPEGVLLRSHESEFAQMVAAALVTVCPEVAVGGADLAARIKVLKDTFALRKKLKNTLTLREFKAFFGAPR
jgi:hypothetical protein